MFCCFKKHETVSEPIKKHAIGNSFARDASSVMSVKMASINFQTPEVGHFEEEKAVMARHLDTFFKGVEIYAWQETKANGYHGLPKGGDYVVKEIQRDVFGGDDKYKWILPVEAFDEDMQNINCDSSIMYDSSVWSLKESGSAKTVADQYDQRTVVWGVFSKAGSTSNSKLAVFNTHATWGVQTGGQFDTVKREIDKVTRTFPGVHVVLVGDFNNTDWQYIGDTTMLKKAAQATGGNYSFDWVFTTEGLGEPKVTYGSLGGDGRAVETGSDHEPVLIEASFAA
jgi:endonuclease/exonuclease/phosphatase family metal-dependent hydrolase